jgi:hypothetical protein
MKELKTIKLVKIYNIAWLQLLSELEGEEERFNDFRKEYGRINAISEHRIELLKLQIEELHESILELEKEN